MSDLRKLAEAATPGPWVDPFGIDVRTQTGHPILFIAHARELAAQNASYIAAASPDVVLGLLDEIESLKLVMSDDCGCEGGGVFVAQECSEDTCSCPLGGCHVTRYCECPCGLLAERDALRAANAALDANSREQRQVLRDQIAGLSKDNAYLRKLLSDAQWDVTP